MARRQPGLEDQQAGGGQRRAAGLQLAVRMGLIESNPVRSLEKPKAGRRDHVISADQFRTILFLVKDAEFRDLLTVCWETGCRPQEALSVEAAHVDVEGVSVTVREGTTFSVRRVPARNQWVSADWCRPLVSHVFSQELT